MCATINDLQAEKHPEIVLTNTTKRFNIVIEDMNKLFSKKTLTKILSVFCIFLLLCLSGIPMIHRAFASNFTASNVTFDPATGRLSFDHNVGSSITGSDIRILAVSGGGSYWISAGSTSNLQNNSCTSSHCDAWVYPYSPDDGVTQIIIGIASAGYYSQSLNYPLPLPTTYTSQKPSAGVRAYQVNATEGQTTSSGSWANMTSGTQSITLAVKSIVKVTAHADVLNSGTSYYAALRTVYNSGGTDTEIGTQGYSTATANGQSITAGGVVTLNPGTYTIALQDSIYLNPGGTGTYHFPSMEILIIPSP